MLRADDQQLAPILQPGVPSPLLLAWAVPAELAGQSVTVRLPIATEAKNRLSAGTRWDFIRFGAETTLPAAEGGSGDTEETG